MATYSGNLLATLSAKRAFLPFRTLEELTIDSEYKLYIHPGGIVNLVLKVINLLNTYEAQKTRHCRQYDFAIFEI